MELEYAHIAESAIVSASGSLSLIGILTGLNAPTVPTVCPRMVVAVGIRLTENDENSSHELSVSLVDPENHELRRTVVPLNIGTVDLLSQPTNFVVAFDVLVLTSKGPHEFKIRIGDIETSQTFHLK